MSELLRHAPVKMLEVCARDEVRRVHGRSLQSRFQTNVECEIILRAQIRQRLGILLRKRFSERLEGFKCYDPGRDAASEVFSQERPERLIFPRLNIARAPIVHQHESEDVIDGAIDWHRFAE